MQGMAVGTMEDGRASGGFYSRVGGDKEQDVTVARRGQDAAVELRQAQGGTMETTTRKDRISSRAAIVPSTQS